MGINPCVKPRLRQKDSENVSSETDLICCISRDPNGCRINEKRSLCLVTGLGIICELIWSQLYKAYLKSVKQSVKQRKER